MFYNSYVIHYYNDVVVTICLKIFQTPIARIEGYTYVKKCTSIYKIDENM